MRKAAKKPFDPQGFLDSVGPGKVNLKFRTGQSVFAQGDVADKVFYIQKGKVKLIVVSQEGKEAVVAILGTGQFFGEGCLNGQSVGSRPRRRWRPVKLQPSPRKPW